MGLLFNWKKESTKSITQKRKKNHSRYHLLDKGQGHIEAIVFIVFFFGCCSLSFKLYRNLDKIEQQNIQLFKQKWEGLENEYGN